jgi:predicted CXXCH cytochrome family protein
MTQLPGTNSIVADFDGVVLETDAERFTLSREGNEFWVAIDDLEEWRAAPEGAKPEPVHVRIGLVTGSHHMQVFWLPGGFGNAQLGFPFTWLIQDRRWAPRHDVFIRDPHAPQQVETWNMSCIRCHSTAGQPRPRKEQETFDTRVGELGIACEACHGPGEVHVARALVFQSARAADATVPEPTDWAVVQPATLDKARQSHVCAQCHSMKWFDAKEDWVENGFRYRPGDDLESTTPILRPSRLQEQPWLRGVLERAPQLLGQFFWSDGMIRVAGREFNGLLVTACYQKGEMTCLSCHSLHDYEDRDDQLKRGMDGNRACVGCHDAGRFGPSHSHHPAGSSGDLCYNCHMPHTTYALLKGVRQHQVDSPRVATTLATGRPNACNLCHQDRSLTWTAERLTDWYGHPPATIPEEWRETSEIVRLLLSGDAGQRALAAWHLGWEPARALTGDDWQPPLLSRLLVDPYAAVRAIAHRSLALSAGYSDVAYDFAGAPSTRETAVEASLRRWTGATRPRTLETLSALLLKPDGQQATDAVERWMQRRDDRLVHLRE